MMLNRTSLFFLFILCSFAGYSQCPLDLDSVSIPSDSNLLLHLPFDGNLNTLGSGNYTVTKFGGQYVNGICGSAMEFDGIDDYVEVSPAIFLPNDLTIAIWAKVYSKGVSKGMFSTRQQCPNSTRGYSATQFDFAFTSGRNNVYRVNQTTSCAGGDNGDRYDPGFAHPSNEFVLLAVTVDNNSNEARAVVMYNNCQETTPLQFGNASTNYIFNGNYNWVTTIGARSKLWTDHWTLDGALDEVRVYDRILTENEIEDIYHACRPLSLSVDLYTSCNGDSAYLYLSNPEEDVLYSLMDITNNQQVGASIQGNCDTISFFTGLVQDTTQFQLQAVHSQSNCTIMLDSVVTLSPLPGTLITNVGMNICEGDSAFAGGIWLFQDTIVADTLLSIDNCDSIVISQIIVEELAEINLGPDTVLCQGEQFLIDVVDTVGSLLWNTGSTGSTMNITQGGIYWCELSIPACNYIDRDTIIVTQGGSWQPIDIYLCQGDTFFTQDTFFVQSGNYTFTYTDIYGCDSVMEFDIQQLQEPELDLGNDTTVCIASDLLLHINDSINLLTWNTGDTGASITVSQSGLYWVKLESPFCDFILTDSIRVNFGGSETFIDTTLCQGDTLHIGNISIDKGGISTFTFTDHAGCDSLIEVFADLSYPPWINLGPDTMLCLGEEIVLDAGSGALDYYWNTGFSGESITVTDSGWFWVELSNDCGSAADTIEIGFEDCEPALFIPNVFTPNGDNVNEFFEIHGFNIKQYNLYIFNRWGEQLYYSEDIEQWWDGTYHGKHCPVGVYFYLIEYQPERSKRTFIRKGSVTILK